MAKRIWMAIALFMIIPGLLFTVSCAKKKVASDAGVSQSGDQAAAGKSAADRAREEELARQRALEEQRMKEEAAMRKKYADERARFENEDVYFEFDSSTLLPMAQEILKQKALYLKANAKLSVVVEGHCDERGTNEYNLALGDRRAKAAMQFLVDLGVPASRIKAISYGEERPMDSGQSEESWAKNRRAHFVIE